MVDEAASGNPTPPITQALLEQSIRLANIFMPNAMEQYRAVFEKRPGVAAARFVHYTTAEAALKIIRTKRLWMRNTSCMADYREVQHGFDIYRRFFGDKAKSQPLAEALDMCSKGIAAEAIRLFDNSWDSVRAHTYVTSVSIHEEKEDRLGRLSMWRAFGSGGGRVGIVFDIPGRSYEALALGLMFNPVAYPSEGAAHDELRQVIHNVHTNCEYLRSVDREFVKGTVFAMLLAAIVCLKHEGFHEEREWRAIYLPKVRHSPLMESCTEVVAGLPQIIFKIPLDATASEHIRTLEFSRIFDQLIVGPTQFSGPLREAFVGELLTAGVPNAASKVFVSDIPIRT